MNFPETVCAFIILDNANLDPKERQVVLSSTSSLEYTKVNSALKRIFGSLGHSGPSTRSIEIKTEDFYSSKQSSNFRFRGKQNTRAGITKKKNPIGRDGIMTKCRLCESIYHYASNCPENERRPTDVHLAETKKDANSDKESLITIALATGTNLLYECLNHAILDIACSGTVCGQAWLEYFLD